MIAAVQNPRFAPFGKPHAIGVAKGCYLRNCLFAPVAIIAQPPARGSRFTPCKLATLMLLYHPSLSRWSGFDIRSSGESSYYTEADTTDGKTNALK